MKNEINHLILTEEHRAKILEMSKFVFPNWKDIKFRHKWFSHEVQFYTEMDRPLEIAWYEFVIRVLMPKLKFHLNVSYFEDDDIHDDHPVDFAYKEFKKLKEHELHKTTTRTIS